MRKMDANLILLDANKYSLLHFKGSKFFYYTNSIFEDSHVIVCDNNTNELFKVVFCDHHLYYLYDTQMAKIDSLNKIGLAISNSNILRDNISYYQEIELRPLIYNIYDRNLFSNSTCARKFCSKVLQLTDINKSVALGEYTKIINEMLNSNNVVYFQEFVDYNTEVSNFLNVNNCAESIKTACEKHKKFFDALYKMYQTDSPFAGTYKVTKDKFTGNKSNNFDIIKISFQMVSNKSKVYDFINKHPEFREEIIRPIFNHHAMEYANFMRLYDVVLTTANELVFSFCFKEKAEKLLSK